MSGKAKKLPDVYYIAPNGMKLKLFGKNSVFKPFALDMLQQDIATECKLPKDMLFPDEKLVNVTFKYDEVSKCQNPKKN